MFTVRRPSSMTRNLALAVLLLAQWVLPAQAACTALLFDAAQTTAVANVRAQTLAVGDINQDGAPDILVGVTPDLIQPLLNDGAGRLRPGTTFYAGQLNRLALGDLNQDGKLDLVASTAAGLRTYLGLGGGNFHLYTLPAIPGSLPPPRQPQLVELQLDDFDLDGHLDLAVADYADNSIRLLYGNIDALLGNPRTVALPAGGAVTGFASLRARSRDLGALRLPNLFFASLGTTQDQVGVQRHHPFATSPWQSAQTLSLPHGPFQLAGGDLNGDGEPELLVTQPADGFLTTLTLDSATNAWAVSAEENVSPRLVYLTLQELNGDAKLDLVATTNTGTVIARLGNGNGTFGSAQTLYSGQGLTALSLQDLNRDGAIDIIALDSDGARVVTIQNKCIAPRPDLQLTGLEIVQSVQSLANDVPLIAGKRTFARVHASANVSARNIDAKLWATDALGQPLGVPIRPMGATGRAEILAQASRQELDNGFLFELPVAWTSAGTIDVQAEINNDQSVLEADRNNNRAVAQVRFHKVQPLPVTLYQMSWRRKGQRVSAPERDVTLAAAQLAHYLPVEMLDLRVQQQETDWDDEGFHWNALSDFTLPLLERLRDTFEPNSTRLAYFLLQSNHAGQTSGVSGGLADAIPGRAGLGSTEAIVHEFGHLLSLRHVAAGNNGAGATCDSPAGPTPRYPYPEGRIGGPTTDLDRYVGFESGLFVDDLFRIPLATVHSLTRDVMTYCNPRWFADWSLREMQGDLGRRGLALEQQRIHLASTTPPARDAGPAYVQGDFVSAYGVLDRRDRIVALETAREAQIGTLPAHANGDYQLELLDAHGDLLAVERFAPQPYIDSTMRAFRVVTSFVAGTRRLVLRSPAGEILRAIDISKSAPRITDLTTGIRVLAPAQQRYEISWKADDPDADPIRYVLLYSADDKLTWRVVAAHLNTTNFTLTSAQIPGTFGAKRGYFRVVAYDGFNSTYADGIGLVVPGKAPVLHMTSPAPGASYMPGQPIALQATTWDMDESSLHSRITWRSDLHGALGAGELSHFVAQRLGRDRIVATATDSDGRVTTVERVIMIGDQAGHTVECTLGRQRIEQLGGYDPLAQPWRRSATQVMAAVAAGERYFVRASDGSLSRLTLARTKFGTRYLRAQPDAQRVNNLRSLKRCSGLPFSRSRHTVAGVTRRHAP